jgi:hypothetical protein
MKRWFIVVLCVLLQSQAVLAAAHTCAGSEQTSSWMLHESGQDAPAHNHGHTSTDNSAPLCAACVMHCHPQPATFNSTIDTPRSAVATHPVILTLTSDYPPGVFERIERPKWNMPA